jgi:hypothetical protein
MIAGLLLDPGGDVQRLNGGDRGHAVILAPSHEVSDGAAVGPLRVRVADVRREEFQEAPAGAFAGGRDECREERALP